MDMYYDTASEGYITMRPKINTLTPQPKPSNS
jgi:hypothetical protein